MDRILNALFMASPKNIYMAYIVETIDKFFQYEKNDCPDAKNENDKTRKLFSF